MPVNTVFSWLIRKRIHEIDLFRKYPVEVQGDMLHAHLRSLGRTDFGRAHGITPETAEGMTAAAYKAAVPVRDYNALRPWIDRILEGEGDVLWPGIVELMAKSSGTTSDRSKFIPLTQEAVKGCHYKGGKDLLALYVHNKPDAKLYGGKHLVVAGSSLQPDANHAPHTPQGPMTGDLSALLIRNLPFWCEARRTPARNIALMESWDEKIEKIAQRTLRKDVRILAGVPSWTQVVLERVLELAGEEDIHKVWPNLQMYMHGGVAFAPYAEAFRRMTPTAGLDLIESYNASEGCFGIQDRLGSNEMLLMLDYGIWYEFVPLSQLTDGLPPDFPETLGLADIEIGVDYAPIISTNGGLHRYFIGDVIRFTSRFPFRFQVAGRTQAHLNLAGEELMVGDAERAMAETAAVFGAELRDWTATAVRVKGCDDSLQKRGLDHHAWTLEFAATTTIDLQHFTAVLDEKLRAINSDYDVKRTGNHVLGLPDVAFAPSGTFTAWMRGRKKLGGQFKVPRLSMDTQYSEEIRALFRKQTHDGVKPLINEGPKAL
jgi:hypothetical protein